MKTTMGIMERYVRVLLNATFNFTIMKLLARLYICMLEIALVRLSETSDYLHGQVNNPSVVIRWTSEN